MKTTQHTVQTLALSVFSLLAIGCANDDSVREPLAEEESSAELLTTFSSGERLATRTSMSNHAYLTCGDFMWETGDAIWVKNGSTLVKSSSSDITTTQPTAKFQVAGSFPTSSYEVFYTGAAASSGNSVTIATAQTQSVPNTTTHFGASGDCGTATATRVGDHFEFMLDHKASYLCFLPRITNAALGANVYLTKIVVRSDNNIAGDYTLSLSGLSGAGASNSITLTTGGSGTYSNGFPLTNTVTSVSTNAAYMVIAPGTHTLTVDYYIKDPVTNVEGAVTKTLVAIDFQANKVYDITANLTPTDYASEYYTAEESETFNLSPNSNLMVWYAEKGSPHWDTQSIWSTQGHLYCQGMWYKKATVIAVENNLSVAELNERDPQGNDLRPLTFANLNGDALIVPGRPSLSEINNWFYVPSLGYKYNGTYIALGLGGLYFTANTQGNSVGMHLSASSNASRVDMVGGDNLQMPLWFGESSSPLK